MEIRFFCPVWGMTEPDLESKLRRIKAAGFDGVELGATKYATNIEEAKSLLEKYQLLFIAQTWTVGNNVEEHMRSLEEQVAFNRQINPVYINSQSGKDHFSVEDNMRLLQFAETLSQKYDIKIIHETHRGRFAFAAHVTDQYLDAFPSMNLTADFSHWCCVSESLLEDQSQYIDKAIEHAVHIHARVGYAEGPQVTDPRAGEWQAALDKHLTWWDRIVEKNRRSGLPMQTITPEFGPALAAYMHTLPFTNMPVADQWNINCYIKDLLSKRYNSA